MRQALGLDFDGMTWPERFVATNIRYDFRRHGFHDANMVLDPKYGAVVARLDEDDLWRCTFSEDDSLPLEASRSGLGSSSTSSSPTGRATHSCTTARIACTSVPHHLFVRVAFCWPGTPPTRRTRPAAWV